MQPSTFDRKDRRGHPDGDADTLKRGGYVAARSGLFGLLLWLARRHATRIAASWATVTNAVVAFAVLLAVMLGARDLHETHRKGIVQSQTYSAEPSGAYQWPHSELVKRQYRGTKYYDNTRRVARASRLYVSLSDFLLHKVFLWAGIIAKFGMGAVAFFGILGAMRRKQEDAWEAEHGRDTPAYREAEAAAYRAGADQVGRDDWLLNPPKSVRHDPSQAPKFGARNNSVQRGG